MVNQKITSVIDTNLIELAAEALERIKIKSELKKMWEGSGGYAEWLEAVTDLQRRLTK